MGALVIGNSSQHQVMRLDLDLKIVDNLELPPLSQYD